jgi:autotransporter translocation and assembly factor TamB
MTLQGAVKGLFRGQFTEVGGPTLTGTAELSRIMVTRLYGDGESATASWDRGQLHADYDESGLALQASLQRRQRQVLNLDMLVPLEGGAALKGRAALDRVQLGPLIAFAPGLSALQGEVSGELELYGTLAEPQASGRLELSGGELVLIANPTPLEKMQLVLELQGSRGKLVGEALLGGGPVRMDGELQWQPELQMTLRVEGERQNVLYPPATEMLLSESLHFVASPGLLRVRGDVVIHEGSLEPEVLPEGSVAVSSDIVEVDYAGNVIREQLPFDIDMDVNVTVENRFRVQSSLAVATLGGELRLLQRAGQPLQLFGTLSLVSGEVRAYQQQLRIQRGTLAFSGRPDNPSINVRAVRRISGSNVVVGMQVLGTYDALSLEVFSEPEMSEGEKMSYLVRGRGLDSGAGEDGTALALSVASGVVNSTTLVSELNRIPGVSNVSFGADGSAEDTAATLSGYIGERIYLAYGIGVYEPINVLIARLYLRTRLWLEVVSRLENSIDLYYAFDID